MSEKRARYSACRNCRCLPALSDATGCQPCNKQSLPCSLNHQIIPADVRLSAVPSPTPRLALAPSLPPSEPSLLIPPQPILGELVDLYFRLIHDGPHTLFHEPTFLANILEHKVPKFLVLAVISLSARFSTNEYFRNDARSFSLAYASAALELLQNEMIRPALETIQGYVLISQHLGGEGDVAAKHICAGLAHLHSQSLHLWETSGMKLIDQQVRRRTYLSVVIIGKWSTADMSVPSAYADYLPGNLQLLDEEDFIALRDAPVQHGIWTQMAKSIDMFREILDIIGALGSGKTLASQIDRVTQISERLDQWEADLPGRLRYQQDNYEYFQRFGFGKTFLAMHIGYHHYRQLLYFPFLDPRNEQLNPSTDNHFASKCKKHAMMVSEIGSQGGKLVYFIIGHILVVSSSIHLHTLLLGGGNVKRARADLLSNFDILMKLKRYWPVIDAAVGRLRSFQNLCRVSSLDSFVLDDWMWKFLMAQSAVLDENRSSKHVVRSPFVSNPAMSNDVLVDNALSWLLD